jgi:hypothetical protein
MSELILPARLSTDDALLIVIQNQQEQARYQQEQAQIVAARFDTLEQKFVETHAKLDRIEKNTLMYKGYALRTAFNSAEETLEEAQTELDGPIVEQEAKIVEFAVNPPMITKVVTNKTGRTNTKEILVPVASHKTSDSIRMWEPQAKRATLTTFGKWFGSVVNEAFRTKLNSRYHPALAPLANILAFHYLYERDINLNRY